MFFFVSDAFRVMWAEHGREIRVCALEVFLHGRFWFVCRLGTRQGDCCKQFSCQDCRGASSSDGSVDLNFRRPCVCCRHED